MQYLTTNNCLHLKIKYINYVLHYLQLVEGSQYLIEEHIYIHILYVEVSHLFNNVVLNYQSYIYPKRRLK